MEEKKGLTLDYGENVRIIDKILRTDKNFDLIKKVVAVGDGELTLYYVDGFVKDGVMTKMITYLYSLKGLGAAQDGTAEKQEGKSRKRGERSGELRGEGSSPYRAAEEFMNAHIPYVESTISCDLDLMIQMVLSGATLILGSTFGNFAIIVDARTYPARETGEPEGDKVTLV